jgi:hypothetical protein
VRYLVVLLWVLGCSVTSAVAQVSIGIGLPGVSIGINLPVYPQLVQVPGYPVYYAPQLNSNFFFYDGLYWVYQGDNWYASSWYNGPWGLIGPQYVPPYVLRIPVRYYRVPPPYFRGWKADAPPRWGEHWGNDWSQNRKGWDQWNRKSAPAPAPLPSYQRQYSGDRYPHQIEQQQALRSQNYRYQPHDPVVQQHDQAQRNQAGAPQDRASRPQNDQSAGAPPLPQKGAQGGPQQRGPAVQDQGRPPPPGSTERAQEVPTARPNDMPQAKGKSQAQKQGQEQGQGHPQGQGQGQGPSNGRNKAAEGGKP